MEECILREYEGNQSTSIRLMAQTTSLNKGIVWKIYHKEKLFPYNLQRMQALKAADKPQSIYICHWFFSIIHSLQTSLQMYFSQMGSSLTETDSLICIIPSCAPPLTHMRRVSMLSKSSSQLIYGQVLLMIILLAHTRFHIDSIGIFLEEIT